MGATGKVPIISWQRRLVKRLAVALLAGLIIGVAVFFLLPAWLSNEQGRIYMLQRINRRLAVGAGSAGLRLAADEWSLSWFHGAELKNARLELATGGELMSASRVQTGLTLWNMLWGDYDIRTTTLEGLQLQITQNDDGTNSLAALGAPALKELCPTLRGAVLVNAGQADIRSVHAQQSVQYQFDAVISVSGPGVPFQAEVSAAEIGGPGQVSCRAVLPALDHLDVQGAPWDLLQDVEFSAAHVPTRLACDLFGLDPGWSASLGELLEELRFSNHPDAAPNLGRPALLIRGEGANAGLINLRLLLKSTADGPSLALGPDSGAEDLHADASLRLSSVLAGQLQRINPIFDEIKGGDGAVAVHLDSIDLPLRKISALSGAGRISFPALLFEPRKDAPLGQLLAAAGNFPAQKLVTAEAGSWRIDLNGPNLTYDHARVSLGNRRVDFSGSVSLDESVNLIATLPGEQGGGLSSEDIRLAIRGTVRRPIIERPR